MLPARHPDRRADTAGTGPLLPAATRAAVAEFVATAIFVFAAEGSVYGLWKLYEDTGTPGGLVAVALAHALALALAAAVAVASDASGGHANPAVTFGVLVGRRISFGRAVIYCEKPSRNQVDRYVVLGGQSAVHFEFSTAFLLLLLDGPSYKSGSHLRTAGSEKNLTALVHPFGHRFGPSYSAAQPLGAALLLTVVAGGTRTVGIGLGQGVHERHALLLEAVMTFGLMYAVYATAVEHRSRGGGVGAIAPLAIGFVLCANILAGGPFDGAAMNPERAFGPELARPLGLLGPRMLMAAAEDY
ncbi:putative aquaporin TIP3-2 [Dichanthelium oligosanthes]|uniref:Putative aquaporin TIP3-2 n=1 Tax=Dichanthelium oligosanthes TaxID=888268 RepID=A0A1E5WH78_9POAL|nr:putative aquaporin TIP3-2 [Dichanthelium oligosanthes]